VDPTFDDDPLEDSPQLASDESDLRDLEQRIARLQTPEGGGNVVFAKGVALATSMGFVVAGCLAAGFFLGDYAAARLKQPLIVIPGILLGLVTAIFAVTKLIKPLMKSGE
jgi:hypothetical protein